MYRLKEQVKNYVKSRAKGNLMPCLDQDLEFLFNIQHLTSVLQSLLDKLKQIQ